MSETPRIVLDPSLRGPAAPDAFTPQLVRELLERYSRPGDTVLDPFAGHGTTLWVAEELGRVPLGLEIQADRVEQSRRLLRNPEALIQADARQLRQLGLPPVDLVLTSPPYMTRSGHPQDPMSGYSGHGADYRSYLTEMTDVLLAASVLLKPGGRLVVNVADLVTAGESTPIAADTAAILSERLAPVEEVLVEWPEAASDAARDVCLVYTNH